MKIEKLKWDTDFFGFQIGRSEVSDFQIDKFEDLLKSSREEGLKLIYVYPLDQVSINSFVKLNIPLVATNLIFEKSNFIKTKSKPNLKSFSEDDSFKEIEELAFLSGEFSRFKKDINFINNEFNFLYTEWIKKAINKEIANEVIVYKYNNKICGFISYKINHLNNLIIGLIAVKTSEQGHGIGKSIMQYIETIAVDKGIRKVIVSTQLENVKAVAFYKSCGYKLLEKQEIFHIWIH